MEKPIKHYIQDLIIDAVNTSRHLDTTIHITLSHKKMSQIKKLQHNKHSTEKNYM